MDTVTHTPWTCGPSFLPSEYGITITDSRGIIVASTYAEYGPLLAAAPALLAALRELDTAAALALGLLVDAHDRGYGISEVEPIYDALAAAKEHARVALAKAEGREP